MTHELMGINNNRVDIEKKLHALGSQISSSGVDKEFVVSDHDDQFYSENMYENFGELAEQIRTFIESVMREHKPRG